MEGSLSRGWDEDEVVAERQVYSVSQLNAAARTVLETGFAATVWVEGELSNVARPSSGHIYFTLKDAQAQVRCAMFRGRNSVLSFTPSNGMHVLLRARVSLYEGRGEFQLVVESMEAAGDGLLRQAFERLKQKLAAEGLFDAQRKRPLPSWPRCIGVITSPTGAAIRDVLSVIQRRFPAMPVIVYPVPVQGQDAAPRIAAALRLAAARDECDVILLTRGGGSLEDLWAFNEEVVARAIAACTIPVISGVGHEIDFTISDFVADMRAPTPSAAAELITPDQVPWRQRIARDEQRLRRRLQERLRTKRQQVEVLAKRLAQRHPQQRLRQHAQRLDELENRLRRRQREYLARHRQRLAGLHKRLAQQHPALRLFRTGDRLRELRARLLRTERTLRSRRGDRLAALAASVHRHSPELVIARLHSEQRLLQERLGNAVGRGLQLQRERLSNATRALNAVSPLATLARGYAVVTRLRDGALLTDASQVSAGEVLRARLYHGTLLCTVNAAEIAVDSKDSSR
jgi:exodeoxyribonuclease VII large subunit